MDILKPPTDNLYKFAALSGLIILIFSVIYPQILLVDLSKQISELLRDTEVLKVEQEDLIESLKDTIKLDEGNNQLLNNTLVLLKNCKESQIYCEEAVKKADENIVANEGRTQEFKSLKKRSLSLKRRELRLTTKEICICLIKTIFHGLE